MIGSPPVVFVFFLNSESGAISWISKLQATVATSTAEAEARSLFAASQELEFLRELSNEIGIDTEKPTKIHLAISLQPCIAMTNKTGTSKASAISIAQKAQKTFLEKVWNFSFFLSEKVA